MGFWFLDERAQLALLMAGLLSGCGSSAPSSDAREWQVVDPAPRDMRVEHQPRELSGDPLPRDFNVVDPLPSDLRVDQRRREMQVVDMVPPDASASWASQPHPAAQSKGALPLDRALRARIAAVARGSALELTARPEGQHLSYRWKVSGGGLDRTDGRTVRWTPPRSKGRHLAQLTVRDGSRAVSVDIYLHEVK
jgi:hypothetical protein